MRKIKLFNAAVRPFVVKLKMKTTLSSLDRFIASFVLTITPEYRRTRELQRADYPAAGDSFVDLTTNHNLFLSVE
jgi:hypothetical protein